MHVRMDSFEQKMKSRCYVCELQVTQSSVDVLFLVCTLLFSCSGEKMYATPYVNMRPSIPFWIRI